MIAGVMRRFRARRMREFVRRFGVTQDTRILDVGGTPANWLLADVQPRVTLLNMPRGQERGECGFTFVSGDGCQRQKMSAVGYLQMFGTLETEIGLMNQHGRSKRMSWPFRAQTLQGNAV
jgi:hypothetical protein